MPKNPYTQEEKDIMIAMKENGSGPTAIATQLQEEGFFRTTKSVTQWIYENKDDAPELQTAVASPVYTDTIKDYILTRLETMHNKSQVAREVKRVFRLEQDVEAIRSAINATVAQANFEVEDEPVKRLFFDIETSPMVFWGWRCGQQYMRPDQIIDNWKVICIGYKWQHEDQVYALQWDDEQGEKEMLKKFIKILGEADEIIGHNIDRFDLPKIRTRAIYNAELAYSNYRTLDTLKKARKYFSFPSNKLDELGKYLGVGQKMETGGSDLWKEVAFENNREALDKMVAYCKQDVILTEDVFSVMMPYIDHNTNHAVLKRLDKWHCPECTSEKVELSHTQTTPMGYIKRHMKCNKCRKSYHVSNRTYLRWIGADTRMDPDKKK